MSAASTGSNGRNRFRDSLVLLPLLAALACAVPSDAHVLSMSHGSLQVDGKSIRYELRMPLTELPDGPDPARTLLGAFHVLRDGESGARTGEKCQEEPGQGLFVCEATYSFAQPPDRVAVRCEFPSVTVPHHIHILRSGEGAVARQTVFDITSRETDIRFTPPTLWEVFSTELGAGARRAITSPELLLFLVALSLAGRGKRELSKCVGAFLLAQAAVAVGGSVLGWIPPARFLEAAAALTVAYLASEVLFLPNTSNRWLACGAMGCFHGLFLAAFLVSTRMHAEYFLPGAFASEALLASALAGLRLRFVAGRAEQLVAILLLVGGLGWFGLRLIE